MSWWKLIATHNVTSARLDLLVGRLVCFVGAPALLYFAVRAIERHATTMAEVTIGLLAAICASLLFILVGLLLPLASPEWRQRNV